MASYIGRRKFLATLGGAAPAWPLAARGQQRERMRRIGVLMHLAADDPEGQSRVAAFLQGLQEAGWAVGRNVNIDVRWAAGEADRYRRYAMEIVALTPDVILTSAPPSIRACNRQQAPCRSYSYWFQMRSAQVLSTACRARAATPPGSPLPNLACPSNGWSCSKRSRPR